MREFPVKDSFYAMEVTEPQFKIQDDPEIFKKLWVDFSKVRSDNYFARIERVLGMENYQIVHTPRIYQKIIFSGHRGNGKSVELKRFSDLINGKDAFFSIFIDLEAETNIEQFSSEDLLITLISILIRELEENDIDFEKKDFEELAEQWTSETEVEKEIKNNFSIEAGQEAEIGWSFWSFFKIKGNLKSSFSRDNATTKTIRRIVKNNPQPLIDQFNSILAGIKQQINNKGKGKDIIFFIDGLEKANREVYENLFIKDVQILTSLNTHIISTVPIDTYYEIIEQGNRAYFKEFYLPMIRINPESKKLFKDLVYRRIDKSLIDDKALEYLIEQSGGCPRILLKMVNRTFQEKDKLDKDIAEKIVIKEGNERYRTLSSEHKDIIVRKEFSDADKKVLELLQSLTILEYNGLNPERKLLPLLERFF